MVGALLAAMGSHWVVLQSVAWATMLAQNLQVAAFSDALDRTFDGRHPCPLCKQIAAGKSSEKKTAFPLELKRFEFLTGAIQPMPLRPYEFRLLMSSSPSFHSMTHSPPTPPPRAECA